MERLAERIGRTLERKGVLVRDAENSFLAFDPAAGGAMDDLLGVEADQRAKLERLARYVSRPPVAVERLTPTAQGQVRYRLKTPYRDGTTDIVLEPWDFLARLAALAAATRAFDEGSRGARPACGVARGDHAGGPRAGGAPESEDARAADAEARGYDLGRAD